MEAEMRGRRSVLPAVMVLAILSGAACVPPPAPSKARIAIIGDSMFASTSATTLAEWARSRYENVWFNPYNGAGLLREPPGYPGRRVPQQLPPSGSFPEHFVVSSGWNDLVVGGYEPEAVMDAADDFLETLAAEGVECVAWLLNRDQEEFFVYMQKWPWVRGNLKLPLDADSLQLEETFDASMADLAEFNEHLRSIASAPIAGTMELRLIEWGRLAESTAVVVTVPAGIGPAQPIYWSGMYDKGLPGPDQNFAAPNNDFDTVHPGDVGLPSGGDIEASMISSALAGC
jgi:hypothetical protein